MPPPNQPKIMAAMLATSLDVLCWHLMIRRWHVGFDVVILEMIYTNIENNYRNNANQVKNNIK